MVEKRSPTIAFLIEDDFEDLTYQVPRQALEVAGAEIVVLGSRGEERYQGVRKQVTVLSDATTTEEFPLSYDAIVIPGGLAPDLMRVNMRTVDFVREAARGGRLIAAIGHGLQVLIEADLVKETRVAAYSGIKKDLENAGATIVEEPITLDGHILTTRRVSDLPIFTVALLKILKLNVEGIELPNVENRNANWWQLAEQWGGSSRAEIIEAVSSVLAGERYALDLCNRHVSRSTNEALKRAFGELCTNAQRDTQYLSSRLADLGSKAFVPVADGAEEAVQDWHQYHDERLMTLHMLRDLQQRIGRIYGICNRITDPRTVEILNTIEIELTKNEKHLADFYHSQVEGATHS